MTDIEKLLNKKKELQSELAEIERNLESDTRKIMESIKACLNANDYGVYLDKCNPEATIYVIIHKNACNPYLDQWGNVYLDGIAAVVYVNNEDGKCHRLETTSITDWNAVSLSLCKQSLEKGNFQSWSISDVKKLLVKSFSELMEEHIEKHLYELEHATDVVLGLPKFTMY